MLMMVLRRQFMTFGDPYFITTPSATINSSVGSFRARITFFVEIRVIILLEKISVLIVSHVHLSEFWISIGTALHA